MTQKDFEKAINRMLRRVELLRDASKGSVKLRAISVGACSVREHDRAAHVRYVAPKGWKPRRAS